MSLRMRRLCCKNKKHCGNSLAGTSFSASLPGFYVVEAAVTIPVFVVFMVELLFFFLVMQLQMEIQASLNYTGKLLAEAAVLEKQENALLLRQVTAKTIFLKHVKEQEISLAHVRGKEFGIRLDTTASDEEYVCLKAVYRIRFPITLLGRHGYTIRQQVKVRKWKGDAASVKEAADWVYVTPKGTAYHESMGCPYLDLSIRGVAVQEVWHLRNQSGGKYYACNDCENPVKQMVYITDYGTLYHTSLGCTGLKRSVQKVKRTETGERHACPKCGG